MIASDNFNAKYSKQNIMRVNLEEIEDIKLVIRIRKSKKDRQHNGQKKKDKRTNNDLQNITHKAKDREARTQVLRNGKQSLFHKWRLSCYYRKGEA